MCGGQNHCVVQNMGLCVLGSGVPIGSGDREWDLIGFFGASESDCLQAATLGYTATGKSPGKGLGKTNTLRQAVSCLVASWPPGGRAPCTAAHAAHAPDPTPRAAQPCMHAVPPASLGQLALPAHTALCAACTADGTTSSLALLWASSDDSSKLAPLGKVRAEGPVPMADTRCARSRSE